MPRAFCFDRWEWLPPSCTLYCHQGQTRLSLLLLHLQPTKGAPASAVDAAELTGPFPVVDEMYVENALWYIRCT